VYGLDKSKAINFTLSIGELMLPKEHKGYGQTNPNMMLEFLSQVNSITLLRTAPNGFFVRLEYIIFLMRYDLSKLNLKTVVT
jgi:hypothetical protein